MPGPDPEIAAKLERLRRLIEETSAKGSRSGPSSTLPHEPFAGPPERIEDLVRGEVRALSSGRFVLRETVVPVERKHGGHQLASALEVDAAALRWLADPLPVAVAGLGRAVFVDVESTGLAGGTGTFAFLVGLGSFDGRQVVARQYLMRGPEEEAAMLDAVAEAARGAEAVVTFNGKAFDLPLLETRYVLARRRFPFPDDHVDLLFGSRRVWKRRLESCRLANLEQRVLGLTRWDDVPSALVPQLYQDYLRTGDGRYLVSVFEHNLLDVMSLVVLAGRLGELHRRPLRALEDDPLDLLSLGRAFERGLRQGARAPEEQARSADLPLLCYREALAAGIAGEGEAVTRLCLAGLHKRRGEREQAVRQWQELAAPGVPGRLRFEALIELAKYHEHSSRDLDLALGCAEAARAASGAVLAETKRNDLARRIARLEAKRRRACPGPGQAAPGGINPVSAA